MEITKQPSEAEILTDRQLNCCSARDMWRTTVKRRTGWDSQAELNLQIINQQEKDRPAEGGKPLQSTETNKSKYGKRRKARLYIHRSIHILNIPDNKIILKQIHLFGTSL